MKYHFKHKPDQAIHIRGYGADLDIMLTACDKTSNDLIATFRIQGLVDLEEVIVSSGGHIELAHNLAVGVGQAPHFQIYCQMHGYSPPQKYTPR